MVQRQAEDRPSLPQSPAENGGDKPRHLMPPAIRRYGYATHRYDTLKRDGSVIHFSMVGLFDREPPRLSVAENG
jgi:hypothetical protein